MLSHRVARFAHARMLPAALTAAAFFAAPRTAQADYTLTYDANTGSLSLDTDNAVLYTYEIFGSAGDDADPLNNGPFIAANHIQLPGNATNLQHESLKGKLADTNITGWNLPDPVSIGNVLPKGLTRQQFEDNISAAYYVDKFGSKAFFDFDTAYIPVPEPTSLALLLAGGLTIMNRRHRPA